MGEPKEWLLFAESDLKASKALSKENLTYGACFHAQQTVEKSLKAIIKQNGGKIPRVHDLRFLLKISKVPGLEDGCEFLNKYYVESRYPETIAERLEDSMPTPEETEQAVKYAQEIFDFASSELKED